jgi:hypothetical protein
MPSHSHGPLLHKSTTRSTSSFFPFLFPLSPSQQTLAVWISFCFSYSIHLSLHRPHPHYTLTLHNMVSHHPTATPLQPNLTHDKLTRPSQADSLTEEQVSEFKEAFSLFVSVRLHGAHTHRAAHVTADNAPLPHRTKTAMAKSQPKNSAP